MRLEGSLYIGDRRIYSATLPIEETSPSFSRNLDRTLLRLCKEGNIPLPLWLQKNSREFARFHQTAFFPDQFTEEVNFDQLYIKLLEE